MSGQVLLIERQKYGVDFLQSVYVQGLILYVEPERFSDLVVDHSTALLESRLLFWVVVKNQVLLLGVIRHSVPVPELGPSFVSEVHTDGHGLSSGVVIQENASCL